MRHNGYLELGKNNNNFKRANHAMELLANQLHRVEDQNRSIHNSWNDATF